MVAELHSLQSSAAALPAAAQASLNGLSERLNPVISEVTDVLKSDAPVKDKLARLRATVEHQVQPILAGATARVQGAVNAVRSRTVSESTNPKTENGVTTANGDSHQD